MAASINHIYIYIKKNQNLARSVFICKGAPDDTGGKIKGTWAPVAEKFSSEENQQILVGQREPDPSMHGSGSVSTAMPAAC